MHGSLCFGALETSLGCRRAELIKAKIVDLSVKSVFEYEEILRGAGSDEPPWLMARALFTVDEEHVDWRVLNTRRGS